jgi:uncharacterized protein (TIGR03435 family)
LQLRISASGEERWADAHDHDARRVWFSMSPQLKWRKKVALEFIGMVIFFRSSGPNDPNVHLTVKNRPIQDFLVTLSGMMGRPVLDRTGLTGQFDFALDYEKDPDAPPGNLSLVGPALDRRQRPGPHLLISEMFGRAIHASQSRQSPAVKAIEGASGARALSHINQIAMEQAKNRPLG